MGVKLKTVDVVVCWFIVIHSPRVQVHRNFAEASFQEGHVSFCKHFIFYFLWLIYIYICQP